VKRAGSLAFAIVGIVCIVSACWIQVKAFAAQLLINSAWERTQNGATHARPWPWADTTPVARLTFHDSKTLVVLEGSSGRNLAFAPSHDAASVRPGEQGNSVISAHRDTHFRELKHARPGDRIEVERPDGNVFVFSVTDVRVVDSRRARLALDSEAPRLTLVTCYPFDAIEPGGPLRFVVTADLSELRPAGAGYTPPRRVARAAALPRPVPDGL
jgi:sortase A